MPNNPNFPANWDSRLIPDLELEEATEADQPRSNIAPVNYGLDGHLNPEAYPHHTPNGAMNHTRYFGTAGLNTLDDYDINGNLLQPTSTTSALPPSPASNPSSMTEGSSRSPSNGPGTPGSANDENLGWLVNFLEIILPQLTSAQLVYYHYRFKQGNPLQPHELQTMVDFNNMARSSEPLQDNSTAGPAAATQSAFAHYTSTNAISHDTHAHGTQGPQRTQHAHERERYAPYSTTFQAAASGADLNDNNTKSTGAALTGGGQSSSTSGFASSSSRPANATAGPSTSSAPIPNSELIPTPESSPRYGNPDWTGPFKFTPAVHRILNDMFLSQGELPPARTCHFPGCMEGLLKSRQSRNRHVWNIHLKSSRIQCAHCPDILAGPFSYGRHIEKLHPKYAPPPASKKRNANRKGVNGTKGKGGKKGRKVIDEDDEEEDGPSEMISLPKGPRKDDHDDASLGGMGGIFAAGSYGTLQA